MGSVDRITSLLGRVHMKVLYKEEKTSPYVVCSHLHHRQNGKCHDLRTFHAPVTLRTCLPFIMIDNLARLMGILIGPDDLTKQ